MRAFKIGILIASALSVAAFFFFSSGDEKELLAAASSCTCNTTNTASHAAQCMDSEQETGWFSWLTGDSRSAQFHYLDLLELLTSHEESKQVSRLGSQF